MIETLFNKRELFLQPSFEEDWSTINAAFEVLAKGYKIYRLSEQEKQVLEQQLKAFSLLKNYISVSFVDALLLEKDSVRFNLVLLKINSEVSIKNRYHIKKENTVEYEFIGILNLNQSFGHVIIRPETFKDKISELFNKVDIDFDDESEFSKKYFVSASDENTVIEKFPRAILHLVGKQSGMHLEIIHSQLVIQFKKRLTQENTVKIAHLASQILENQ